MSLFEDKKILLFAPRFFGYEKEISDNIQKKCKLCVFFDERANPNTFEKICIRLNFRNVIKRKINFYYQSIIDKFDASYFDYVIFLNPETITFDLLKKMKEKQKKAVFVIYMWDSFENKLHTKELLPLFDKKLSFNKKDCDDYNLTFRPLFFIDKYDSDKTKNNNSTCDIDLGFIGTIHSDRYKILKTIKNWAELSGLKTNYYMYFPSIILYYKYKIENIRKQKLTKKDFHFCSLNSSEVFDYISNCKVIIDIQHPKQVGLTMRTIEMLGLRKKLITTNDDIKNYDFYNEDNICIINRDNVIIDKTFLVSKYNNITDSFRQKYSIDSFTNDLLYKDDKEMGYYQQ